MSEKKDFIGKETVFVSKSTTLPVGMKRFDKGPYFDFYHKDSNYTVFTLNVFIPSLLEMMSKKCIGILEEKQSCMMFQKSQYKLRVPMPENF